VFGDCHSERMFTLCMTSECCSRYYHLTVFVCLAW
jgi:hypothetical protein